MFIKLQQVIIITALSRPTIYRFMKEGKFPKQVKLGERSVGWLQEEVAQWMQDRISTRDCKRRRETVPLKRPNTSVAAVQKCTAPAASSSLPARQMAGGGGCTAWRCINEYGVRAMSMV